MTADPKATKPTDEDCTRLLQELRLSYSQAFVALGSDKLYVHIFKRQKKPTLKEWVGWPIEYRIGGGKPRAFGDAL